MCQSLQTLVRLCFGHGRGVPILHCMILAQQLLPVDLHAGLTYKSGESPGTTFVSAIQAIGRW